MLLPCEGALSELIRKNGYLVSASPLWVLRRAKPPLTLLLDLLRLPWAVVVAAIRIQKSDITYINTCVLLDYYLAAGFFPRGRVIAHIREIPAGFALTALRAILIWSKANVIFNSEATKANFSLPHAIPQAVIHNGVVPPYVSSPPRPDPRLRLVCIGRLNEWKGQDLILEALVQLTPAERALMQVRIVGGGYGESNMLEAKLRAKAEGARLDCVNFIPFTADPTEHYKWAHVVLVPSRRPEPFGRVAIEGMAHSRPVIAASHGGLTEIVRHGWNGLLFRPNDPLALASEIRSLLNNRELITHLAKNAYQDFEERFALSSLQARFETVIKTFLSRYQNDVAA